MNVGVANIVLILAILYEHFNGDPDETSTNGVTGQSNVDPQSDPLTHVPVELVVTPLSRFGSDACVYDPARTPPAQLALRAFRGRIGAHDGRSTTARRGRTRPAATSSS